jgi:protein-S-isoprenylcysteine O-methyltransferase Ste14
MIMDVLSFDVDLKSETVPHSLVAGSLLVVIGAVLRLQCYNALGRHFTFEAVIGRDHQLVKDGPYNYMRHPSYTGAVLAYIGLLIYYGSNGTWFRECFISGTTAGKVLAGFAAIGMSLVIFGLLCRISKEDRALKEKFGRESDIYVEMVVVYSQEGTGFDTKGPSTYMVAMTNNLLPTLPLIATAVRGPKQKINPLESRNTSVGQRRSNIAVGRMSIGNQ